MSRYAKLTDLKLYAGIDGTTDDALLQLCLDSAEGAIEDYTRRQFVGTVGTVFANRFDVDRVRENTFWLQEDVIALDQLVLGDGQIVPSGSYWLQPRSGPPYRGIQLRSSYVYTWNTDADMTIAGTFGYSVTAPQAIKHATIRLATYMYRAKDQGGQTEVVGNADVGMQTIQRGIPADVLDIIKRYRSRTGGAI